MDDLRPSDPPVVGRYQNLGRLGTGGMGVVYLAEGPRGRVALKLVRSDLGDDPSFRARFRREVQASFRVSSTHTAKLIDFDTEADQPWMATEFVDGPSMDELIRDKGPLGHDDQLALATGLAQALAAIHDFDVIHRDLKPANILLTEAGPKVIDFGIAAAADAARITSSGLMVGSPGWLAPEQIEAGDATPASDIFSFGLVLCFAASGEPPFGTGATDALLFRAMNAPPNVPLDKLARQLHRPVLAAISRDPARRPSATELLGFLTDAGVGTTTVVSRELLAPGSATTRPNPAPAAPTPAPQLPPMTFPPRPVPQHTAPPVPAPPQSGPPAAVPSSTYGGSYGGWQPPPAPKRRPGWLVPVAAAAGVLVVAGAVVAIVLGTSGSDSKAGPSPSAVTAPPTVSRPTASSATITPDGSDTLSVATQVTLANAALVRTGDFPGALKADERTSITLPCDLVKETPPSRTLLRGMLTNGGDGTTVISETVAVLPTEQAAIDLFDEIDSQLQGCATYSSVYQGKTDTVTTGEPAAFGVGDDSTFLTETFTPKDYQGPVISTGTAIVRQGPVLIKLVTEYDSKADPVKVKALARTLVGRVAAAG